MTTPHESVAMHKYYLHSPKEVIFSELALCYCVIPAS